MEIKEKIKILSEEYQFHNEKCRNLLKEIDDLKTQQILPDVKSKYQNKFFKYEHYDEDDKVTYSYLYCLEVLNERIGLFNIFYRDSNHIRFDLKEKNNFYGLIEISEQNYKKELNILFDGMNPILKYII